MIDGLSVAARALGLLASAYLLGTAAFLLASGTPAHAALLRWRRSCAGALPAAAVLLLLALFAALLAQAAQILPPHSASTPLDRELLLALVGDTRFGRVWLVRAALAAVLALTLIAASRVRGALASAVLLLSTLLLGAPIAATAALTGHAAGDDAALLRVPAHMLHILALGLWLGALPAWIGLVRLSAVQADGRVQSYVAQALHRFSLTALICMAVIVLSGAVVADGFIDDQGDLLGTRYGVLLTAKLLLIAVVFVLANRLRRRFLPTLSAAPAQADRASAQRIAATEFALGVLLLLLGAGLAQTTPALHDQPVWRLPLRISIEATWPQWPSVPLVLAAAALAIAAALLHRWRATALTRPASAVLAVVAVALAVRAVAVPAFPDSFRRSDVPYLTESIASGRSLFETHCVSCHGHGGLGDGAQALTLTVPPANLSEPHTALHTAGDMFWWFSHGIPASGMPGYAERLDETERWDLVNFLRAFSQGFEARVIGPQIQPRQPWLGAPTFYFDDASGGRADLKDLRRRAAVLLVFVEAAEAEARERLALLAAAQSRLAAAGLYVIAATLGDAPAAPPPDLALLSGDDARKAWVAYQLLSRTLADRGDADRIGMRWRHAEFLIDRFGYIRARWIPEDGAAGWTDLDALLHQVAPLQQEPELKPPPDLHIH